MSFTHKKVTLTLWLFVSITFLPLSLSPVQAGTGSYRQEESKVKKKSCQPNRFEIGIVIGGIAVAGLLLWFMSKPKKESQSELEPELQPQLPIQPQPESSQNETVYALKNMTDFKKFVKEFAPTEYGGEATAIAKLKIIYGSMEREGTGAESAYRAGIEKFYEMTEKILVKASSLALEAVPLAYELKNFSLDEISLSIIYLTGHTVICRTKDIGRGTLMHEILFDNYVLGRFTHTDMVIILPIVKEYGLEQVKMISINPRVKEDFLLPVKEGGVGSCVMDIDEEYINDIEQKSKSTKLSNLPESVWNAYKATLARKHTEQQIQTRKFNNLSSFFIKLASLIEEESKKDILEDANSPTITEQLDFKLKEESNTAYDIYYINQTSFSGFTYKKKEKEKTQGLYYKNQYLRNLRLPNKDVIPQKVYVLCLILSASSEKTSININRISYYIDSNNQIIFVASENIAPVVRIE